MKRVIDSNLGNKCFVPRLKTHLEIPEEILHLSLEGELALTVFCYCAEYSTRLGKVPINLRHIVDYCGYAWNPRKGQSVDRVKQAFTLLCRYGYLQSSPLYLEHYEYITLNQKKMYDFTGVRFAQILFKEIESIRNYKHLNNRCATGFNSILRILSYIRIHQIRAAGNPSLVYALKYQKTLLSDLSLSKIVFNGARKALEELQIMVIDQVYGRPRGNPTDRPLPTVYVNWIDGYDRNTIAEMGRKAALSFLNKAERERSGNQ